MDEKAKKIYVPTSRIHNVFNVPIIELKKKSTPISLAD